MSSCGIRRVSGTHQHCTEDLRGNRPDSVVPRLAWCGLAPPPGASRSLPADGLSRMIPAVATAAAVNWKTMAPGEPARCSPKTMVPIRTLAMGSTVSMTGRLAARLPA